MEKPQYDVIAEQYNEVHSRGGNTIYEKLVNPTVRHMLGDVHGKTLLDLACGDGVRTVMMKKLGTDKTVGVDISSEMIKIAIQEAKKNTVAIEFIVGDCSEVKFYGEFDIKGVFLHSYASTRDQFLRMCKLIYANMKSGGKFVGITQHPTTKFKDYVYAEKHGVFYTIQDTLKEGESFTITTKLSATPFSFNAYYWSPETYEWAFKEAGFSRLEWIPQGLYDNESEEDREFYKDYVAHSPVIGIMAWK